MRSQTSSHKVRRGKSKIDSEMVDWQELEGGGRVLRISLSNALVCSQFPPRRPIPQPLGSERWQADTGASASITNHRSDIFNVREVNSNEEFEQIGNKGLMPIVAIGSVLLRFVFLQGDDREHKVETQVDNVLVVPGMGVNLFSGWRVSVNDHAVSLHAAHTS